MPCGPSGLGLLGCLIATGAIIFPTYRPDKLVYPKSSTAKQVGLVASPCCGARSAAFCIASVVMRKVLSPIFTAQFLKYMKTSTFDRTVRGLALRVGFCVLGPDQDAMLNSGPVPEWGAL